MTTKEIIKKLYKATGKDITEDVENILDVDTTIDIGSKENITQEITDSFKVLYDSSFQGLIVSMLKGKVFIDKSKIEETYGNSIEAQFPESSIEFYKVANSYWTFKLAIENAVNSKNNDLISSQVLGKVEIDIASIFFPTQGPLRISPKKRGKAQRELLTAVIDEFDIENFDLESYVTGNPYLKKKKFGIL